MKHCFFVYSIVFFALFMLSCREQMPEGPEKPGTDQPEKPIEPEVPPVDPEAPDPVLNTLFSPSFDKDTKFDGYKLYDVDDMVILGALKYSWRAINGGIISYGKFANNTLKVAVDDWIVLPGIKIENKNTRLSAYFLSTYNGLLPPGESLPETYESYEIYISTIGQELENFTSSTLVLSSDNLKLGSKRMEEIKLDDYIDQTMYVAFRHNTDADNANNLTISDINVREYLGSDLSVGTPILDAHVFKAGTNRDVSAVVYNGGTEVVEGFNMTFSYGTQTVNQHFDTHIARGSYVTVRFTTPITVESAGESLYLNVELTDNDQKLSNNKASVQITCPQGDPAKRLLGEHMTSQGCHNCAGSISSNENRQIKYPDKFIGINVHVDNLINNDSYECPEYVKAIAEFMGGVNYHAIKYLPRNYITRADTINYGNLDERFEALYSTIVAPATIEVAAKYDAATREIKATTTTVFAANAKCDGYFRLGLAILEDDIVAWQSGAQGDVTHSLTARVLIGGVRGEQGSLPTNAVKGEVYNHDFFHTVPLTYYKGIAGKPEKMSVVAIMYNYRTGVVINCAKAQLIIE